MYHSTTKHNTPPFRQVFFHILKLSYGLCFLLTSISLQADSTTVRPNIVLILVDDVALMDFGAYGGEAHTPHIDQLAQNGTMLTNHHASPMCAPSRAMLLTGYDSHLTGVPNLPLFLPPEYPEKPGYEGILNNQVRTVASYLKAEGYQTYMTGKWHLGHTEETLPSQRGFDRTYILDASGADNYEHRPYLPTQSKPPWYKDGQPIDLPEDFYSSRNLVDEMIGFMKENEDKESPFFAFLSFQAIHIPVQAPREITQKYEDVYQNGWDDIRQRRFQKAKEMQLIPATAQLGDMLPVLDSWESLSKEAQRLAAKSMAVNAAMLDAMDEHIGRYMAYLKQEGRLDNTIFIITGDNGPEASNPNQVESMKWWLQLVGYTRDYETLGEKGSFNYIGPEFASAAASPSSFFKFYAGEGGLRVPLIISGASIPTAQQKGAFSFITDITPTILELAGVTATGYDEAHPFTGRSLLPLIQGDTTLVYGKDEAIGMEAASQAALFRGDMKLVRNNPPYGDGVWRLYHLATDPGETQDLSKTQPDVFQDMMAAYEQYAAENGVLEMPEGYETLQEIQNKLVRNLVRKGLPWVLGIVVLVGGFVFYRRRGRG